MEKLLNQELLNSITITTREPIQLNIDKGLKETEQSLKDFYSVNMYKEVLDFWYYKMFDSVKYFQKTMRVSSTMSSQTFTKEFRTVSFNLGRQAGASTAIIEFIKEHPDLNVKIICPLYSMQLELEHKFKTKDASKYFSFRGASSDDIDVVFIDSASYFELNLDQSTFLSKLNSKFNINQWIIKLG